MSKTARKMVIDGFGFDTGKSTPGVGREITAPSVNAMSARGGEMRRLRGPSRPPGGRYVPGPQALRRGRLSRRRMVPEEGSLCAY